MEDQYKTKEQLINELAELRQRMTELEKSEAERKQMEERLQFIKFSVDHAPDTMVCVGHDGRFINVNDAFCRSVGYSREELLSMTVHDIDPDYSAEVWPEFWKRLKQSGSLTFESCHRTKEGKVFPVETTANFFEYNGNEYHCGFARDITERKRLEEILKKEQQELKLIIDSSPIIVFYKDKEGKFIRVNKAFSEALKMHEEEFVGKTVFDLYSAKIAQGMTDDDQEVLKSGSPKLNIIGQYESASGIRWVQTDKIPICDKNCIPVGLIGFAQDIPERKRAEEALRESEGKYRNLVESISDVVYTIDSSGVLTYISPVVKNTLGYEPDELIGRQFLEFVHKEDHDLLMRRFSELREGIVRHSDYRVIGKYGDIKWVRTLTNPIIEEGGFVGARGVLIDITERKQAEEALRTSQERFRQLFDGAPIGYHEIDSEGRITRVNRTESEMLGYTPEEMLGQPVWKFNDEEETSRHTVLAKLAGTIPPGRSFERTYRRKDGATFPVIIEDRPLRDSEGRIIGIRSTIQDITERKQAEEEMATLQEQLRQSQKMEAIGRLAGGIVHDFNNLLTVIRGYSQLSLMELKEGDHLKGNLEEVKRATERASDLIRQLLAFSRRQTMEVRVLDLNILLQNLNKMLRRVIGEDIELVTRLADDLGRVKVDPGQIEQVIMNLTVNARDAMIEGGKLTIETANVELDEEYARRHVAVTPGRYVMLAVSDTGVGITPEVRERIFEPFFTTKKEGEGTGLGLATVYGIVKQSEGNIWIYSEPEKGTTFKIYLPLVNEPLEEKKERVVKEASPRGNETILAVEDDEVVRRLAMRILSGQGYKVLEASQGVDAFLICEEHKSPIHLLLTDVVMPKMSGRELAERLSSIHPEIKVLYMSGYTDNTIVHHGVLKEGINYIPKPFTVDSLIRKVRGVLDKK